MDAISEDDIGIWRSALQIVETGVRASIMKPGLGKLAEACRSYCELIETVSIFLLEVRPSHTVESRQDIKGVLSQHIHRR